MADHASSTPLRVPHPNSPHAKDPLPRRAKTLTPRQRRQVLENALERLLGAVDIILADLDALDGDADLEPSLGSLAFSQATVSQTGWADGGTSDLEDDCEDEGAACEDEGHDSDRETDDHPPSVPYYADDGANQLLVVNEWGSATPVSQWGVR